MKESYTPLWAGSDEYEGIPDNLVLLPESRLSLKLVRKQLGNMLLISRNLLSVVSIGFMAVSLAKECSEQYCAALTSSYCKIFGSLLKTTFH